MTFVRKYIYTPLRSCTNLRCHLKLSWYKFDPVLKLLSQRKWSVNIFLNSFGNWKENSYFLKHIVPVITNPIFL